MDKVKIISKGPGSNKEWSLQVNDIQLTASTSSVVVTISPNTLTKVEITLITDDLEMDMDSAEVDVPDIYPTESKEDS